MANMSYCKFQNTLNDLRDCYDAINDNNLSEEEERARDGLVKLCAKIVNEYPE